MQPDNLSQRVVDNTLTTRWLGRPYYFLSEVDSTNEWLKEQARSSESPHGKAVHGLADHGTAVLADYQTRGKGRRQRSWQAPPGSSLLLSILLRPGWPAERANWLVMLASLAAAATVTAETGLPAGIKWPNDLVTGSGGSWRKLGGILLEIEVADDRLQWAVLGIGINVNIPSAELPAGTTPATSLSVELGRPVSRLPLLSRLLAALERGYETADAGHSPHQAWNQQLVTLGQPVRVTPLDEAAEIEPFQGVAVDTDSWGRLLVRDANGEIRTVAAGDVTLRPNGPTLPAG